MKNTTEPNNLAKPFLKWAGGKTQLIPAIEQHLPQNISLIKDLTYIEPFIGSGAVFFWFIQKFNIKKAIINDINTDLINVYRIIKDKPEELIEALKEQERNYYSLTLEQEKKDFFLNIRAEFNLKKHNEIDNAAFFIFLNRTCFNGLYRVNSKNGFNVPFGKYIKPKICDPQNILAISKLLKNVTILNGDYTETLNHSTKNSFFYFDPPYKPISKTSSFNAYSKDNFDDEQQKNLADFTERLTKNKHLWLLSNSDPKNLNPSDLFFDELYSKPANTIVRVKARRMINSNAQKRGEINEVLIMNYPVSLI
ncbi:DNA adenine methylase [Pedobacter jejuensis]|uniref:site-specific DNA-methyltransferase (adenine-specific) n=1 Tax=Pedobacter jejuensis TaxID=1268550 RepID=A0A3N0BX38_9SPHI|nr:DNA adenine methylase [Pedobacter jejuensis]RNL54284.1 DNA adenine methylase [Pedobacter jejuensis]